MKLGLENLAFLIGWHNGDFAFIGDGASMCVRKAHNGRVNHAG